MGIKQIELVPISSTGPTPLIPSGKPDIQKFFQATRTDTAAGIVKAVVPAQSSVLQVTLYGSVNVNNATTATGTITIANNSGTISTGTVNLLTGGATTALIQMSNLPNIEPLPLNGDLKISFQYAETGTASTLGGPWVIGVTYV